MGLKQHNSMCPFPLRNILCQFFTLLLMSAIRVGSLNINGARDVQKRMLLYELIKQKNIDVVYVQETHSDCMNAIDWKRKWEREVLLTHMSSNRGEGAVLFAKSFLPVSYQVEEVIAGRLMIIRATFEKYKMAFINVYAPTNGTERICFLVVLSVCFVDNQRLYFIAIWNVED